MKKSIQIAPLFIALLTAWTVSANEGVPQEGLDAQLEALRMPANQAPLGVNQDKLFSIQDRYTPLKNRHEFSLSGANNFTPDSLIVSRQMALTYRYHLTHRWGLALQGAKSFNALSDAGSSLLKRESLLPKVDYLKASADLSAEYHVFYGKFRLSSDQVLYFDQYFALGGGVASLESGTHLAGVADVGLAFWLGQTMTFRFGFRNHLYSEVRASGSALSYNLLGHIDIGVLLGGGGS